MGLETGSALENKFVQCPCCLMMVDKLHPRSHIIPAFIAKTLADEKGRIFILGSNGTKKVSQSGFYKSIVCNECEIKFGPYDTFFARCFKDKIIPINIETKLQAPFEYEIWSGVDGQKLYMFCLSIILRAHLYISKEISGNLVGEAHFRKITDIFLNGEFIETDYPIMIRKLSSAQNLETIIQFPIKMRIGGHNTVKWTFFGLEFTAFISSHEKPDEFKAAFLKENGTCIVIKENFEQSQKIHNFTKLFLSNIKK